MTLRIALCTQLLAAVIAPALAGETSLEKRIDEAVTPFVEARDFMGVVAVGRDTAPPILRAYGEASVELGAPHSPDHAFMIGSVSKQFTAAALLLLAEDGALDLDAPVRRYLPEFRHEAVTLHQLLTHTAGVLDVYSLPRFGASEGRSGEFAAVVADLSAAELAFPPGTGYAYSNGGYTLAAAVIERVSGMPYGEFVARRIFEPLGMHASGDHRPAPAIRGRVPGYDPWGARELTPAPAVAPAYLIGSGSLWATAADLLTWAAALHGGAVLSDESYARMTRDHGSGYGYGVSVFERFGRPVVGHDGRVSGYASDLARYVDDRLTVAVLGNVQSVARDQIRRRVAAVVLGEPLPPVDIPSLAAEPPVALDELSGVYAFGPGFEVTVAERDGRLMARANQGGWSELVATVDGSWFSRMLYATVRFGRDDAGRVDRLLWGAGDGAPVGVRQAD